ncbi:MAG: DUF3558 domain-containing protein [Nocardia sp.]|nr:DUF3558 domain-containing protein [Nocardia sp.]
MTRVHLSYIGAVATTIAMICTSCSSSDTSQTTSSETSSPTSSAVERSGPPTLTASELQPPSQDNQYTKDSGRPKVAFDPCTWIPDSTIQQAGFDPRTRKRGEDQIAEITFLICHFDTPGKTLTVISGNATWDEDLQKNGRWSEPVTINGRRGMQVKDPALMGDCDIHLPTKAGFLDIGVGLTSDGKTQDLNPCDGLDAVAAAIEPSIGKGN